MLHFFLILEWFRNSSLVQELTQTHWKTYLKRQKHVTVCPGGTKQNWVRKLGNIWLARANTIRQKKKKKFWLDYVHAGLKQLSPALTAVRTAFSNDTIAFLILQGCAWFHPFAFAHAQHPWLTHQQREEIFHNLLLSLTRNHQVAVREEQEWNRAMLSQSKHLPSLTPIPSPAPQESCIRGKERRLIAHPNFLRQLKRKKKNPESSGRAAEGDKHGGESRRAGPRWQAA